MSDEPLDTIARQAKQARNFDEPPLEQWRPALSGDIDIRIAADGCWYHEGEPIRREAIVRVFASILRREEDGEYYLVTPVEKWRIQVDAHALIVTDIDVSVSDTTPTMIATLNTGRQLEVNRDHRLFLDPEQGNACCMRARHGLSAMFTRAAWYRLAELADEKGEVESAGEHFALTGD
ncbi:MAG: DUF1285 domain-containing protein [Halioglobus sp.]